MIKFGTVTQLIEKRVSIGSATPPSKGSGTPASPKFLGLLHACTHTQYEKQKPIFAWWSN